MLRDNTWDRRNDKQLVSLLERFMIFLVFKFFTCVKIFNESLPDGDTNNYYMEREWTTLGVPALSYGACIEFYCHNPSRSNSRPTSLIFPCLISTLG